MTKLVVEKWEVRLDSTRHRADTTIDRYAWDRHGRTTKVERFLLGRKMLHKEYRYNKAGEMAEAVTYREGQSEPQLRNVYTYDDQDRQIKKESYLQKGHWRSAQ